MSGSTPPTWDEIRTLIDRVDQVCRESEFVRAHAERMMRQPTVWPDRRRPPKKHGDHRDADRPTEAEVSDKLGDEVL